MQIKVHHEAHGLSATDQWETVNVIAIVFDSHGVAWYVFEYGEDMPGVYTIAQGSNFVRLID